MNRGTKRRLADSFGVSFTDGGAMMKRFTFKSRGYANEANAWRVLDDCADMIGEATCFVATQRRRCFPVVIFSERHQLNISALTMRGITIVN